MLKSRLRSVFQRKCELFKKQPGIKLCIYKRQGRRGCLGFLARRGGFGFCFVNLNEDFVPTETLPLMLSLRQRWWFNCNTFRFFSCPPLFYGFSTEKKISAFAISICPSSLTPWNYLKHAQFCVRICIFTPMQHRMEVYYSTLSNICRKQTSCDARFLRVQQAEGWSLKADPEVKSVDTIQNHSCTSLPHRRFIWYHIMLMSPPKPQCGEIRTAAAKSLQRKRGKLNKIHLIL